MLINLSNYEEFFVLYMDDELKPDERLQVEAFLSDYPHLKTELDLLMATKLPQERFCLDKSSLLAQSMQAADAEENLLLYIDGELPAHKKPEVEAAIAGNVLYSRLHQQLLQTKLDPAENVVFAGKEKLFRTSTSVYNFNGFVRVAAAVVLVASLGILAVGLQKDGSHTPAVAQNDAGAPTQNTASIRNTEQQDAPKNVMAENSLAAPAEAVVSAKHQQPVVEAHVPAGSAVKNMVTLATPVAHRVEKINAPLTHSALEEVDVAFTPSQQIVNNSPVTSVLAERNTMEAAAEDQSTTTTANQQKGSFKGFLRKATRFIERKTGIDPTNGENDELVIGVVAVKLK